MSNPIFYIIARNYLLSILSMNVDYVVTLSNQTVTTTPNFGSQTNNNSTLLPLSPPCTGSFLTAVVDTSNLAIVLAGNAPTYTRLVAQSWLVRRKGISFLIV